MTGRETWCQWQRSWDSQQEGYLPDREERFDALLSLVGQVTGGSAPYVLDLACGCGSLTGWLVQRFPAARVVGADIDPVLLRIARGIFAVDERITLAETDLREDDWARALPAGKPFDAIVTATALHWLTGERLARLYEDLLGLLRTGGLFANVDHMPPADAPTLISMAPALGPRPPSDAESWKDWWSRVEGAPEFGSAMAERQERFGVGRRPAEFTPPARWHVDRLLQAGASEAAELWRRGADGLVAAIR